MDFQKTVLELLKKIPQGRITTYKEIARYLEMDSPRAVGQALKRNAHPEIFPCYKVVKSDGTIGGYSGNDPEKIKRKIQLLKKDGIQIKNSKIDLEKYFWGFS